MLSQEKVEKMMKDFSIEAAPLAFMRGRTLKNAFIIMDEAQNTTQEQMKMILTRFGEKSKMVITGDPTQNDLARHVKSGLTEATKLLANVAGIGFCHFTEAEVVRHPMVQKIVQAYEAA